jgi:hypothetical protein
MNTGYDSCAERGDGAKEPTTAKKLERFRYIPSTFDF